MKSYKYMHQNGIKVMRISGAFWTFLLVIALSILILLNELKFHFINTKFNNWSNNFNYNSLYFIYDYSALV